MRPRLTMLSLVFATSLTHAALPPRSYDKLRARADEAVTIQVTAAKEAVTGKDKAVTVEAKVLGIERSKAGLKIGQAVTIKYSIPTEPLLGLDPVPLLAKDAVVPAFLRKKGEVFEPAASGWSFKMTPEAVSP